MRHGTRCLIYTSVLLSMIGAIFYAAKPGLSSAQTGFKQYQVELWCGDSGLPTKILGHQVTTGGTVGRPLMGTKVICIGKCQGRRTTMADAFAGLPADLSQALTAKVEAYRQETEAAGWGDYIAKCIGTGPKPEKCEKPTPWFNPPTSGCKDVHTPVVTVTGGNAEITICGQLVFRYSHRNADYVVVDMAYRAELIDFIKSRMGSKVCCDSFRDGMQSAGSGCNPALDFDCDGKPNETDTTSLNRSMPDSLPDINIFTQSGNSSVDPFPPGLDPNDNEFFPPADKCDCKWELKKGTLTCSPDGIQRHVYQAWWRCPSTGNERFTRKEASASSPCTPPQRSR